jgi:hypothetical protein
MTCIPTKYRVIEDVYVTEEAVTSYHHRASQITSDLVITTHELASLWNSNATGICPGWLRMAAPTVLNVCQERNVCVAQGMKAYPKPAL